MGRSERDSSDRAFAWDLLAAVSLHTLLFGVIAIARPVPATIAYRTMWAESLQLEAPAPDRTVDEIHVTRATPTAKTIELGTRLPRADAPTPPSAGAEESASHLGSGDGTQLSTDLEGVESPSGLTLGPQRAGIDATDDALKSRAEPPISRLTVADAARVNTERARDTGESRTGRVAAKGGLEATYGMNLEDALSPVVAGKTVFGSSKKGTLKGTICFVEPWTRRVRDIERCTAVGTVYTDQPNTRAQRFTDGFPGVTTRSEWFAIDYRGTFTVRLEGEYQFSLGSCDGSILWIDGEELVNHDVFCEGPVEPPPRSNIIELAAGQHSIRLLYLRGSRMIWTLGGYASKPARISLSVRRLDEPRTPMMPWKAEL